MKNLHQLLVEMADKEKQDRRPIYSPVKFVKTVWTLLSFWSNGSQQDAHEVSFYFGFGKQFIRTKILGHVPFEVFSRFSHCHKKKFFIDKF